MRARAIAHPNIALVKYWGKRDATLNLPAAGSLSLTLAGISTTTEVEFDSALLQDEVELDGAALQEGVRRQRVSRFLDLIRDLAGLRSSARVTTTNTFPTAAGLASSASGFAALALSATAAAGVQLTPQELSALARRGSGSAARSIFGGFAEMSPGTLADGTDAHALPIAPAEHWDLRCLIALTATGPKELSSTQGMHRTQTTSPLFSPWVDTVPADLDRARHAIATRDFASLGVVAERSCLRMHATALGSDPAVLYFQPATIATIHAIRRAREAGLEAFFTIDAGPHVKVFCPPAAEDAVRTLLHNVPGVLEVLSTWPGPGAHLLGTDPGPDPLNED
jgi:diphosphomevalonate decarboxylase